MAGDAAGEGAVLQGGDPGQAAAHSRFLLFSHYATSDPETLFEQHLRWAERHGPPPESIAFANHPDPGRKLRVGYVSSDFRAGHPILNFIESVFLAHDRERFSITGYSNVLKPDAGTGWIRDLMDEWREIGEASDLDAAAIIRADKIDLLVDLAGHCSGNRLLVFARRAAPVQLTWLGYPNTTGLSAMDYRLSDDIADPPGESERFHAEQLARLSCGFLCYRPPAVEIAVSALPAWFGGRITFGCFQYPGKVTDEVIEVWSTILSQVPRSRLLLHHCISEYSELRGADRSRITAVFAAHGIAPGRLQFVGIAPLMRQHLEWYGQVDIALDTFPYNGTTTTCESLWMGLPVVTQAGRTHAGRVGASILTRVGLAHLVAQDRGSYIALAVRLAADLDGLARLRASLRRLLKKSPLMDAPRFTRGLEDEYRAMWRRWCGRQG
jgi:protein O-GlcNAc transferase